MRLTAKSRIKFVPLNCHKEKHFYIIGDKLTGNFIKIDRIGYNIYKLLSQGRDIGSAHKIIKKKFGDYDVIGFANFLLHEHFIADVDGVQIHHHAKKMMHPIFSFIKQRHVKWLFSPFMYMVYAAFIAVGALIFFSRPFPSYSDLLFDSRYVILIPLSLIISWLLVFLHEIAHNFAAKSFALESAFGVSNRLWYLVATTDVTNVYTLHPKKRNRVYLAGMANDMLIASICLMLLWIADNKIIGISYFLYKILKAVVMMEILGIIWQFFFFIKTDVYYVLESILDIDNLNQKAKLHLKSLFLLNRPHHQFHYMEDDEKKIVKIYSIALVCGIALAIWVFAAVNLPIMWVLLLKAAKGIIAGTINNNSYVFFESLIFLIAVALNQSLIGYSVIKRHRLMQKKIFAWIAILSVIGGNYLFSYLIILIFLRIHSNLLFLIFPIGVVFGFAMISLFENIKKLYHQEVVLEWIFIPVFALLSGIMVYKFSEFFSILTKINKDPLLSAIYYSLGMIASYFYKVIKR